jgi:hypothetical protein
MSEQIVTKIDGIGRTISKSSTTIERNTPNLIAYEGRLHDLELLVQTFDSRINTNTSNIDDNTDDIHDNTLYKVNVGDYTDTNVLNKVKAVDGSGSGLDADLLDGHHASYFAPQATTYTKTEVDNLIGSGGGGDDAPTILSKLMTVDGSGSGLDADLLDGHHASYFLPASGIANSAYKLETARTITLNGDATGSISFDGTANKTLTVNVVNDSHTHDTRYYTEAESNARYLLKTGKAADSNLLDGLDSLYFRHLCQGTTGADPNTTTVPVMLTNHANGPVSGQYFYIITTFYSSISSTSNKGQIAITYNQSNSTSYVRNCYSGSWSSWHNLSTSAPPTTAQVGAATAGLAVYAVGSYILAKEESNSTTTNPGGTRAGAYIRPVCVFDKSDNTYGPVTYGSGIAGTWRCMGYSTYISIARPEPEDPYDVPGVTLWLRIA